MTAQALTNANAVAFILAEAVKHDLPMAPMDVRFGGLNDELIIQVHDLEAFTTWALWLDAPITEEPFEGVVIYDCEGSLYDAQVHLTHVSTAAKAVA